MGAFSGQIDVCIAPSGRTATVLAPLKWTSRDGKSFVVPAGFVTDFASIPRVFWNIYPPIGRYTRAAVLHDYLYRMGLITRAQADAYFLEAMLDCESPWYERYPIYHQVRLWGWLAWRENAKLREGVGNGL